MSSLYRRLPLLLFGLVTLLAHNAFASVLAIDYGSDWIKASLMKPGVPFDILLNKDSKRKIQSVVGWKKDDRVFGGDAANIAGRFPEDSFASLKYLLAAPYTSDVVSFYTTVSTAETTQSARGTVNVRRPDGTEWSVEELIAMQFSYVKDLAESLGKEKVYDVVVVIPPYFSQFERDAVADAIEIAGLRTLALVSDGAAVAVNYAMTRSFPTPEYHVIYDAGASAIRATVASFTTVAAEGKGKKDSTHIAVAGVGYDRSAGGTEIDRRLRDLLAKDFTRKHGRDIREDKRGSARLWKEAGRVKGILSANTESRVVVESIAWDIDYKSKIKRSEFERACLDLKPRFARPIMDALDDANLTLAQVTSVILTGGSSRTPMIQAAVKALVGEDKVAVNVNADEAAVLGAALHGASLSRQFKTKDIKVTDLTVYDMVASYPAEKKGKTITATIFPRGSKTNTRKTMTFKRKEDFVLTLSYKAPPARGFPAGLLEAKISGIAEALKNLTEAGAVDPVVKATLALSESGFASVKEAFMVGEVKEDESIAGKLKGLFGKGSSSESTSETESKTGSESSTSASASITEKAKKPSVREERIPLTIDVTFPTIPPLTVAEKRKSRDRLLAIDRQELSKRLNEDTRNDLEGYLYRLRDLLYEDNQQAPFIKCSKESERQALSDKLDETFAWLGDDGEHAETADLEARRDALAKIEGPIQHRYREIEEFPKALNQSQMWNWSTRLFLTDARQNLTLEEAEDRPSRFTQQELDDLEAKLIEHEKWLNINVERQKRVKQNEDPALETSEMKSRAEALAMQLQKLVKRKIPKPKKPKSTSSTATEAPAATGTDAGEGETADKTSTESHSSKTKHDEL